MNMFKPVGAKTREEYFEMLPEERKKPMKFLDDLIRQTVPELKANFLYNMPGYGSFKYASYKKEILDWPIVAIASQKNYLSVYICALDKGMYLAEKYKDKLGKVSVGKSCIRFKKIQDLNLGVFKEVVLKALEQPGLVK